MQVRYQAALRPDKPRIVRRNFLEVNREFSETGLFRMLSGALKT